MSRGAGRRSLDSKVVHRLTSRHRKLSFLPVMLRDVAQPAHDPQALAAFQNGERRLLYARYKDRPWDEPFYLLDGSAREIRHWAKEHLECFMPDCRDRRLTTVARRDRRDGFSHMSGAGGHSGEGLFHQQAKALIVRWVRARYPSVTAVAEQATDRRDRRADVMLTWPDGRQVAVEIQYAAITAEDWQRRQDSYREQGIRAVWLFGHLAPHLRAARPERWQTAEEVGGVIQVNDVHRAMAASGETVLWINPIDEQIGVGWCSQRMHHCRDAICRHDDVRDLKFAVPFGADANTATFTVDRLVDCALSPDGLATPTSRDLLASHAELLAARERDQTLQAEELEARRAAARAWAAEAKARDEAIAAEEAKRDAWIAARRSDEANRWNASRLRTGLIARYGDVPDELGAELDTDTGVFAHPEHWHSVLYVDLIENKPGGTRFSIADCYRSLASHGVRLNQRPGSAARAVIAFLDWLRELGVVGLQFDGGRVDYAEVVISDLMVAREIRCRHAEEQQRRWAEHGEALRAQRQAELREQEAQDARRRERERQFDAMKARRQAQPITQPKAKPPITPVRRCRVCGGVLAASVAESGRHLLC